MSYSYICLVFLCLDSFPTFLRLAWAQRDSNALKSRNWGSPSLVFLLATNIATACFSVSSLKAEKMNGSWYGLWWRFTFRFLQHWGFWLFIVGVCVRCRGRVMPGCFTLHISSFADHIPSLLWWQNAFLRYRFLSRFETVAVRSIMASVQTCGLWAPHAEVVPRWRRMVSCWERTPQRAQRGFVYKFFSPSKQSVFNKHLTNKILLKLECLFHEWKLTTKINIFRDNRRKFS